MQNDSFIAELRELARRHPLLRQAHPFWRGCFRGTAPVELLRRWTVDVHPFIRDFPLYYLNVAAKCGPGPALTHICETIYEETGSGDATESHLLLFERFAREIGVALPVDESIVSAPGRRICEFVWDVARNGDFLEGVALLGLGIERPLTQLFPLAARAFGRRYGVSEAGVKYFAIHGVADAKHSQTAARIVSALAVTAAQRARVRQILTELWDRQQQQLDSLLAGGSRL